MSSRACQHSPWRFGADIGQDALGSVEVLPSSPVRRHYSCDMLLWRRLTSLATRRLLEQASCGRSRADQRVHDWLFVSIVCPGLFIVCASKTIDTDAKAWVDYVESRSVLGQVPAPPLGSRFEAVAASSGQVFGLYNARQTSRQQTGEHVSTSLAIHREHTGTKRPTHGQRLQTPGRGRRKADDQP